MADQGAEDLVSQVSITGTEESLAKLNAYADGGAKAFDKLNRSASDASKGVEVSAAKIDLASKTAGGGFDEISKGANSTRDVPGKIKDIERAVSNLTSKFPQLTQAVGRFSQRIALVGAAAVAAGVGLARSASNVAKAFDGQSDSMEKLVNQQVEANNSQLAGTVAAINYASQQRQLSAQLSAGKISYSQYTQSVKDLNATYNEQQRVAGEVEAAQKAVADENERLKKGLADRQAYTKLVDTFGGPLLTSMVTFGRQVDSIHREIIAAFGPGASKFIDAISATLSRNAAAISKFFNTASAQIDKLLKNNGPQIQALLENIGSAAASVFTGVINAAPGLIDFFNNVLVPSISKVAGAFNIIADAINAVFGTKLTGGSLVLIAIIAQITGSIKLLFVLLRTGGAIFKGFITVLETVGVAILEVFGLKKAQGIIKLGAAATKSGGIFKTFLAVLRTAIPLITALGTTVAAALGIGFGPALIIIGLVTAALIFLITQVDWKKFAASAQLAIQSILAFLAQLVQGAINIVAGIINAFRAVNAFFDQLGADLVAALAAGWASIVQGAQAAASLFTAAWGAVAEFFGTVAQAITDFFTGLWTAIVAAATVAATALQATWATISTAIVTAFQVAVDFFKGVPATLQDVWDTIKQAIIDAFNSAVDSVKNAFQTLLASAKQFLQPILDLLQAIASLASSATGGGGNQSGTVSAASGGHIRGPGTSTSDSIPAWLSDNEFVVRAKSVAKYGAGLLHAINNGTFKIPRFNAGGLVSSMMAAVPRGFADGGSVAPAALRPLSLTLMGETFAGLLAPEDVGDRLTKFAVARQNKSAGRKPAWVGRGRA